MKNKLYISAAFTIAMMSTACSDSFLEVDSPTKQPIEEYFTTDAHIQEAVVAAYDPLHWPDWAMGEYNPLNLMSDIMADDIWVGGSDKNDNANWHRMMNFEAQPNAVIAGLWTDAYSGVKRCNDVIYYMNEFDVKDLTADNATYYEAQVRVLRVFYYSWLWKFWGNVVYFEKNFDGAPYLGTQYEADDVYKFMIEDLEGAIALDKLPMRETDANAGRVTKAMAYMLYTELVMYQNDESRYGTALKYMQEIINSGLYDLNPDYTQIFRPEGEWSKESIFEVNYTDDNAVRSWDGPLNAGGTVLPTLISPNNWPSGTDGHDDGWGFCPVRQETYDRYAATDMRRDATCWNAGAVADYNKRYQDTGLFLEKYAAHTGDNARQKADGQLNWNNNLRIYRYSETLLNAAELIIRGAGSGSAQDYLDRVRSRAGVPSINANLETIIEERHLEFVGEGKRYWDLIRTGKAATVLVPDEYDYRTNTWTPSKKYLPIPQSEIDKALGTLTQNPY
ncbi:MAG: RagB/SusD family nutrient uptake outer membrane protein [Muribaculaceae bacterium]|nr:RagB/SusD family nutrient uptake outer membrane protein [Muribaculaceae bacterium]